MAGAILTLVAALVILQVSGLPRPPERDAPAQAPTGNASISGRVVAADTGLALRRAVVNLSGPAIRTVQTDADGRYALTGLPSGSYIITANVGPHRAGYLSTGFGATLPEEYWPSVASRPKTLILEPGQRRENIDIRLLRAVAIAGRVVDGSGEPAARVYVQALRIQRGQPLAPVNSAVTDDLGQFRLYGLVPGDYIVAADSRAGDSFQSTEGETVGFALTYAPGTPLPEQATRFRLAAGTSAVADIPLLETRLFSITGVVSTSSGEVPQNAGVSVGRIDLANDGPTYGSSVSPTGTFALRNVPPGSYELSVRHAPAPGTTAPQEFAVTRVDVLSADVEGVVLVTSPGALVTGEILYDDGVTEGRHASLTAQTSPRRMFSVAPTVESQGTTFTVRGLFFPAVIRGGVTDKGGASWAMKAVLLDGRDVTDVPTLFTAAHSGRLQVVFTARAPVVEGTVTDENGRSPGDCVVVVFSEDPEAWTPMSTSIRTNPLPSSGKFTLRGLRPGRYMVVAVPSETPMPITHPDVELLEMLKKVATPVVLNVGEKRTVDLRVVRFDQ